MTTKAFSLTTAEINDTDTPKWEAASEDDTRSPCPMLNALANHHLLPHNGRDVSRAMVQEATGKIGADPAKLGKIFDLGAAGTARGRATGILDLNELAIHGVLEHDASMSRQCYGLGSNLTFNRSIWMTTLSAIGDRQTIDYKTAAKMRHTRFQHSVDDHKAAKVASDFDLKTLVIAYVEISTLFLIFADSGTGEIPVKYIKTLVEEERLPYEEGWRPHTALEKRPGIGKILFSIVWAESGAYKAFFFATRVSLRKLFISIGRYFGFWRLKEA